MVDPVFVARMRGTTRRIMVGSLVGSTRGIPFNRSDMIGKGYARFAANQGSIALQRDEGSLATAERLPLQIVGSAGDVKSGPRGHPVPPRLELLHELPSQSSG